MYSSTAGALEVHDANTQITRVTELKAVDPELCAHLGIFDDTESALNCLRFLRGRSETAGSQLGDRTGISVFDRSTG